MSALLKVARAIERGTLAKTVHVTGTLHGVRLQDHHQSYQPRTDVARSQQLLRWVRLNFPDGDLRVLATFDRRLNRQRPVWIDRIEYRSGDQMVVCSAYRIHEHNGEYLADTTIRDRRGHVQWRNACCQQPLGVRVARELGLAP